MKQPGFFDVEERLARLSGLGDQPEAFLRIVSFEMFWPDQEKADLLEGILYFRFWMMQ